MKIHEEHGKESLSCMSVKTLQLLTQMTLSYIDCPMQVTTLEASGDVGNRPGALHDGGLRKSGKWQEVPLFTNCTIQREYTDARLICNSEINI